MKLSVFWFRRDLRLEDNIGLLQALPSGHPVLPIFIFDEQILNDLPKDDPRVNFIYNSLLKIHQQLLIHGSSLLVLKGEPKEVWKKVIDEYDISEVYTNRDYEPYALERDLQIKHLLLEKGIDFQTFKDQVIFEKDEILKDDGKPYTIYTPYKNKWLSRFDASLSQPLKNTSFDQFFKIKVDLPSLEELGFAQSTITVKDFDLSHLDKYATSRDFPAQDQTSYLSPHLRFGTVSVRQIIARLGAHDAIFKSELIWREFFMQILYHFPQVITHSFKPKYDAITWRRDENDFEKWCNGQTGYPMVDAGMRQLNATGYMHNRVRMVTASFLCKHLLIDWRWGEAYFAEKLLDYELSSNNGNWQWAAGTGCDAAPYFRIFNPTEQAKKFDKELVYIKRWIPEFNTLDYPMPMVDHKFARDRALKTYKLGLS